MEAQSWTTMLASHVVQVTILVGMVWGVTKLVAKERPHLAHALWILVLLKCLAPPTWGSPTSIFSWLSTSIASLQRSAFESELLRPDLMSQAVSQADLASYKIRVGKGDQEAYVDGAKLDPSNYLESFLSQRIYAMSGWPWMASVVLGAIAFGFVFGLTRTWIRLRRFLRSAYASGYREDAPINEKVRQLCKQLGVRRSVPVRIIKNQIGPVVVGLIKPTILLPELIVHRKSTRQLEPLLAHELIHIRRGDLWWALLQTIATSIWWFHPLVRIAGQMVTRESERSCDEETVMSLGCSPGEYAKSLLDVLERKHQLQLAPALPGVRPVDITLNRMERIMKLGQGSHQRTPRWIWATLLLGCALALPGASIGLTQDGKPMNVPSGPTSDVPIPETKAPRPALFEEYRCDVGDLLDMLIAQNSSYDEAKKRLLENLPTSEPLSFGKVTSDLGLAGEAMVILPELKVIERELHISGSQPQIKAIENALARLRKDGFQQVTIAIQIMHFAPKDFKLISKDWLDTKIDGPGASIQLLHTETTDALSKHPKVNCLHLPRVVCMSGQKVTVSQRDTKTSKQGGEVASFEDINMEVLPAITDENAIQISYELTMSKTPVQADSEDNSAAQRTVQLVIHKTVPAGESLVASGIRKKMNGEDRILVICVTPVGGIDFQTQVRFESLLQQSTPQKQNRLQVQGRLTAAPNDPAIDPPTDDEVLHVIEKWRMSLGNDTRIQTPIPVIHLKKVQEWVDKARFVPLIGNAAQYHTLYECTLEQPATPGIVESVYFDHTHFHMVSE